MIPLIQREIVEKHGWMTDEDILDIFAIAESTPGPIAINCATYAGYRQAGLPGALFATLGMILPSFTIIYIISMFLERFLEIRIVAGAFTGIKLGVALLILNAGINMVKKMKKKTPLSLGILGTAFCVMLAAELLALKLSSIVLMLAAGLVSLCIFLCKKGGKA